jgi:galactonate dehydratase
MSDLTITGVDVHLVENPWKPWAFVEVHTDGPTGIGEATLPRNAFTVEAAIREEAEHYVGEDPFDTERLFLRMYRDRGGMMPHIVKMAVISAMDTACWDVKAKHLGVPLYELLGGQVHGEELPAYANGWYQGTDGDPEGFAAAAERVVADGYDALKFDPFGTAWQRMRRPELERAIDVVRAVREAVGPDVELMIEAHYRFSPGTAAEIADRLAEFRPTWFEQPVPPDNHNALEKVVDRSPVPIAVDRSPERGVNSDLIETGVDIVQPDLIYNGGVTRGKKIAAIAAEEYVGFAPHNAQGPVSTALCAHVDTSTPNFLVQEVFEDYAHPDWAGTLLEEPIGIEDGRLHVPEGPGLGVELDHDALAAHRYTEASDGVNVMNLFEEGWEDRSFDAS